ncbi:MAG: FAD-binding oxidoreductase [Chloroflexi bacterium]|nr:FAD-binding oxidoreductase [Chloroflexota bacterium]
MDAPNATLVERRDLTADVASLLVEPDGRGPAFAPGQYATLGLIADGRPILRPYSMAAPHAGSGAWEFHVRRVRGGALTERLWEVPVGGRLLLGRPRGRFVLDPADERAHLFVATGTGIAPFVAMIRDDLAAGRRRRLAIVHGAAHADELGFRDLLRPLAARPGSRVRYVPSISRPADPRNAGWSGATGRAEQIVGERWAALDLDPADTVAYLCGNPGMVAAAEGALVAHGIARADVHTESYWLERAAPAA